MGINETMEVLSAVEASADAVAKACEDGKLNLLDIRHLVPILTKGRDAIKDVQAVKGELLDLDEAEIAMLVEKSISVSDKVMGAYLAIAALSAA
jgi:hypothetical protein